MCVEGGPKAGAMVEEICGQPHEGVVFHGSSTVGALLASMPQIVSFAEQLERVGVAHVRGVEARSPADRVAGDLDERAEIADKPAGDEAGHLLRERDCRWCAGPDAGGASCGEFVWVKPAMYMAASGGPFQSPPCSV